MRFITSLAPILLVATGLAGCVAPEDGNALVAFYVKDAPADEFESVFVTFTRVEVHRTGTGDDNASQTTTPTTSPTTESPTNTSLSAATTTTATYEAGWITLVDANHTVDLKAFQGDAKAFLGNASIAAGRYTQIRIHVTEAWGETNGTRTNFTLPSGKLKITGPWEASAEEVTQLIVDFELDRSIHQTGQGKYMFKPTMKLMVEKKDRLEAVDLEDPAIAASKQKQAKGSRAAK